LKKNYNEKCDLWSCGVILYALLCGHPPFKSRDDNVTITKILKAQYNFDSAAWKNISPQAKDLVRKLLEPNVNQRYSAQEALNDPWFQLILGESLAISALSNLKQFKLRAQEKSFTYLPKVKSKLQYIVSMFLVHYFTSDEEKQDLLEIFQALDFSGTGRINKKDLLQHNFQINLEVDEILKNVNRSGSKSINYTGIFLK